MTKLKKVIKGIECCRAQLSSPLCEECPYKDDVQGTCDTLNNIFSDALELLKEQEPVKPKIEKSVAKTAEETIEISIANCGNCGALIEQPVANESGWSYCPKCGKAVKWG